MQETIAATIALQRAITKSVTEVAETAKYFVHTGREKKGDADISTRSVAALKTLVSKMRTEAATTASKAVTQTNNSTIIAEMPALSTQPSRDLEEASIKMLTESILEGFKTVALTKPTEFVPVDSVELTTSTLTDSAKQNTEFPQVLGFTEASRTDSPSEIFTADEAKTTTSASTAAKSSPSSKSIITASAELATAIFKELRSTKVIAGLKTTTSLPKRPAKLYSETATEIETTRNTKVSSSQTTTSIDVSSTEKIAAPRTTTESNFVSRSFSLPVMTDQEDRASNFDGKAIHTNFI